MKSAELLTASSHNRQVLQSLSHHWSRAPATQTLSYTSVYSSNIKSVPLRRLVPYCLKHLKVYSHGLADTSCLGCLSKEKCPC